MEGDRWQRLREIFARAEEMNAEAREVYLGTACAGDTDLRREIDAMLAAAQEPGDAIANAIGRAAKQSIEEPAGPSIEPGQRIGHYRIVSRLGEGGMGEVFEAEDEELGRRVALKVLSPWMSASRKGLRGFQREARSLAALNHPNIVTIHSVESDGDLHFLTMELVSGSSLDRIVRPGGLSLEELLRIAKPLLAALIGAHEQGVTHRDLKPANVIATAAGDLKVLDFGLAKMIPTAASDTTRPGDGGLASGSASVSGTPGYMSPEQIAGRGVDHRTDLFSLGVLLYELATGVRPFSPAGSASTAWAILNEHPPLITDLRKELPDRLAGLIRRCLEKEPERRYGSARAVAAELERIERESRRARAERKRRWAAAAAVALLALAAAVVASVGGWRGNPPPLQPAATSRPPQSLAVLPMASLSTESQGTYLADGLTAILISELAQIEGLRVISRTSSMRYRASGKSLPEIARELGVEAVVEGSVLEAAARIRIEAKLIHAATDEHLWARSFEHNVEDVLRLQADIARAIAEEIQITLSTEEEALLASAATVVPLAWDLYLQGKHQAAGFSPPRLRRAIELYERAIQVDPEFALPHAGIASAHQILAALGAADTGEAHNAARRSSERALELRPTLAEAHTTLGWTSLSYDRDWARAEREFREAVRLSPGSPEPRVGLAFFLTSLGRHSEADAQMERALQVDPLSPLILTNRCELSVYAGALETAERFCQEALDLDSSYMYAQFVLSLVAHLRGDQEAAAEAYLAQASGRGLPPESIIELRDAYRSGGATTLWHTVIESGTAWRERGGLVNAAVLALTSIRAGDQAGALHWLEIAFEERSPSIALLAVDPLFDTLHGQPRFEALIRRLNMPTSG